MTDSFQLLAMPYERFEPLFSLSNKELLAMDARRMIADDKPGVPCRVSLVDAEVGETVILLPFTHHDVSSPFRATGPIFVRSGASTADPGNGDHTDRHQRDAHQCGSRLRGSTIPPR